ncbi:MAG: N-acetylglucosamine-6-sulfatase [Thermoleophilaceae bacterium]|jgi:arylsulfatase A-like enzyme|nr:N-acetylglucosamine-6-sulfatase [Thermoleophilaceae bacterium]
MLVLAPSAQARPNVLVLMTDDQTLDSMSVMPKTRELIGERGTTFTRSFVNYSLCCPSRSTLYTGQYAHNHGVLSNTLPSGGFTRLDTTNWLPLWLQAAGYRTMHVGKFLNGYGRDAPPTVPPGFNDWNGTVDPSTYSYYGFTVDENGTLRTYPGVYSTDFVTTRANELIAAAAPSQQPFFMSVAFLAPHSGQPREPDDPPNLGTPAVPPRYANAFAATPLPTPASFNEVDMSDKPLAMQARIPIGAVRAARIQEAYQQRLESLLAVDDGVASILNTLRASGELDNTLILFTSDNGFFHGEHRVATGKLLPYEPSIRLPLLMRGPGVPAGTETTQLVTNADLAPTIVDAANAKPGRVQDGRSLLELVRDPGVEWGRELLLEGGNPNGLTFSGLRNYRWKYIEYTTGEKELYDLARDPDELASLHAEPALAGLRARLSARLAVLRNCAGRSCRAKPALRLHLQRRQCRFFTAVRGADAKAIELVRFTVRRRSLARDARAPFRRLVNPGVRPGRSFLLRATVRLDDGRIVTLDRHSRSCSR